MLPTRNATCFRGKAWTLESRGFAPSRKVMLEAVETDADGRVLASMIASEARAAAAGAPVTLAYSILVPGKPMHTVAMDISRHEWRTLNSAAGGAGVLRFITSPSIVARYRPQAWVGDVAQDVDDGREDFDALPAIVSTYGDVGEFVQQMKTGHWDVLAGSCASARHHQGPYEVDLDAELVLCLAALYKGDGELLSDLLAGDATAARRVSQEDWIRLASFVRALSPSSQERREPSESLESLFLESLAAWEGEEDSVRGEHASLIRRMQAKAREIRGEAAGGDRPRQRQ